VTATPPLFPSAFADATLDLEPAAAAARHARGEVLLIDVREQYEWDAGHVPGAVHHEIERIAWRAPTIPRDRPLVFICRGGVRAGMVATAFRAIGYETYSVLDGFTAWHAAGLPVTAGAVVAEH
jgi:rhodanese-related sulfurtransferase